MREIKFRGMSKEMGGWVYGNLVKTPYGINIIPQNVAGDSIPGYKVEPESVGQYTGKNDDDGIDLYEGDIVRCTSNRDQANMVIIFEEGEFRMVLCEKYDTYETGFGYYSINSFKKEKIGNIHENPELLETA